MSNVCGDTRVHSNDEKGSWANKIVCNPLIRAHLAMLLNALQ